MCTAVRIESGCREHRVFAVTVKPVIWSSCAVSCGRDHSPGPGIPQTLSKVKVAVLSDSLRPHGLSWNSPGQNTGVGGLSPLQKIFPTQGSNPGFPHCRQILYELSSPGKPKNTGVGSLSLFQGNFLTQELKRGFLNCRWVLYQLSYQGSPQRECM